jgi:hypothetical protein
VTSWTAGAAVVAIVLVTAKASGQQASETRARHPLLLGAAVSYFAPTKEERQIHSAFLDATVGVELWAPLGVSIHGGLMGTVAWGHILQWGEDWTHVRYDTLAGGVGAMFTLRVEPFRPLCPGGCAGFSLSLDVTGAIVLYTSDFPPGGRLYNFVWRPLGGTLGYAVTPRWRIDLGVHWMHVSNGQGLGPEARNPSYEGVGATLGSQLSF